MESDALATSLIRRILGRPATSPDNEDLRSRLLEERGITLVMDVGANEGLFSERLRAAGYEGRIVSFEPLAEMFAKLASRSANDDNWESFQLAVGSEPYAATLHVAGNWASSSLLPMNKRHWLAEPRSAYVDDEPCQVVALDGMLDTLIGPDDRIYLKVDVQGSELAVLRGAERLLEQVEVIQAEMSLMPLYDGGPLLGAVVSYLDERRFGLLGLAPAFVHPTSGVILQVDGIFARVGD
jgi:FkbM family methyltransferase